MDARRGSILLVAGLLTAACATKTAPPPAVAATPKYVEFLFPDIPAELKASPAAPFVDRGWRYLQNDDLGAADREFTQALKQSRTFYPAQTGEAYVELAHREYQKAVGAFDAALAVNGNYVPALVGRGQALLGLKHDADALSSFERALTVDPSLIEVRRRVDVLQFRSLQEVIERARQAAAAGRGEEARAAYERAIALSPESGLLYRELGLFERRQGDTDRALDHLQKAIGLDPMDATAIAEVAAIHEQRGEFDAALADYRKAAELDPSAELDARIVAVTARARESRLPAEFKAIAQSTQITRGELAALLGIRLETALRGAVAKQVVVTDIRSQWAASWITLVVSAGVMDAYENHTFQPQGRVRRADLATAVSRVVRLLAERRTDLREKLTQRPRIADVNPGHLDYPAVAVAVSTGVLPLSDGRFQVARPVSGAEAIEAVARLQMLADLR